MWLHTALLQGYGGRGGSVANGRTRERDDAAWKAAGQPAGQCVHQIQLPPLLLLPPPLPLPLPPLLLLPLPLPPLLLLR